MDEMLLTLANPRFSSHNSRPTMTEHEDGSIEVTVAAAGVKPSDLSVTVDSRILTVKGETGEQARTHVVNWKIKLPREADVDKAEASLVDGLLSVTFPKKEAVEPVTVVASTEAEEEPSDAPRYNLTVAAPGLAAADLTISIDEDRVINLSGFTKRTGARIERRYQLPENATIESAHASHVDGILTISVPKGERAPEKRLELAVTKPEQSPTEPEKAAAPAVDEATEVEKGAGASADEAPTEPAPTGTREALLAMGFADLHLIEQVIAKNGEDALEACARDLATASEWDTLLDDLEEMGFANRERNQALMLKHEGNVKRTVKDLIAKA